LFRSRNDNGPLPHGGGLFLAWQRILTTVAKLLPWLCGRAFGGPYKFS
jgi:hypothetical protein